MSARRIKEKKERERQPEITTADTRSVNHRRLREREERGLGLEWQTMAGAAGGEEANDTPNTS